MSTKITISHGVCITGRTNVDDGKKLTHRNAMLVRREI